LAGLGAWVDCFLPGLALLLVARLQPAFITGWEVKVVLGLHPGLKLAPTFHLRVELGAEQESEVGQPQSPEGRRGARV
jgi:hypothetical protein